MAVRTEKSVFYHVPKTGGIWVKEAIRRSGLKYGRCKEMRMGQEFNLKREHSTPDVVRSEDRDGLFGFCFVRHPVGWYKSFWAYRIKTKNLDPRFPADRVWDYDFEKFVGNVLDAYPDGFVTQLYQFYVGEDLEKVDFIGRQENLADDLVTALTLAGEEFDESLLRTTRWHNISARGRKLRKLCIPSDELVDRIVKVENWVVDGFYARS